MRYHPSNHSDSSHSLRFGGLSKPFASIIIDSIYERVCFASDRSETTNRTNPDTYSASTKYAESSMMFVVAVRFSRAANYSDSDLRRRRTFLPSIITQNKLLKWADTSTTVEAGKLICIFDGSIQASFPKSLHFFLAFFSDSLIWEWNEGKRKRWYGNGHGCIALSAPHVVFDLCERVGIASIRKMLQILFVCLNAQALGKLVDIGFGV